MVFEVLLFDGSYGVCFMVVVLMGVVWVLGAPPALTNKEKNSWIHESMLFHEEYVHKRNMRLGSLVLFHSVFDGG